MALFEKLFSQEPERIKNGIYYFDSHNHGDNFDNADAWEWDNGRLESNWKKQKLLNNPVTGTYLKQSLPTKRNSLIWHADRAWG